MSKEAIKLALEALELINLEFVCANGSHHAKKDRHEWDEDCPITDRWRKAITALREALAEQPAQQEPKYWLWACGQHIQVSLKKPEFPDAIPLYTRPQAREPLTDEQLRDITKRYALSLAFPCDSKTTPEMFARAIEAAHGIKGDA